jgi:hypothetical protein
MAGAGIRFAIPREIPASRIEMRLFSETSSVLEYLPTAVRRMHVRRCEQGKSINDLLQFAENGRSAEAKPDGEMVRKL